MSMGGGGSSGGQNTVTQTQKLMPFQEEFAQQNQQIAADVAARPYPVYEGQQVAGLDPLQQQGQQQAVSAANSFQPNLNMAQNYAQQAGQSYQPFNAMSAGLLGQAATGYQPALNNAQNTTANAVQNWTPEMAQQYMNPYAMQALAPQIEALRVQQGQQRNQIGANATQAGAFGDARHGVAEGMNDFYGNLAMNGLVSQGMNQAYSTGLNAFQQQEQARLAQGGQMGNLANLQQQLAMNPAQAFASLGQMGQQEQLNASNQMANLGSMQQQLGLQGADAIFGAGTQNQQLQQQQLNTAYQNFMNQQNWPIEMLNLRSSVLSQSPYSSTRLTTAPPANSTAQNLGAFAALSGGIGSLIGQ